MSSAAIAPVPGETRLVGVMLLGERLGASAGFTASDLRLFETLAGHAGMSLEFDRLEQAIRRMRELQGALERQAYRDTLTDLANRALFMRRVHESLSRPSGTSTVLFLDLDDFKRINDDAGHAAGDAVLMAAAERIRTCVRPTDLAARLGGDEFAVLLEDADAAHGEEIAHRIMSLLSEAVPVAGQPCWVRASIGIASAGARLRARRRRPDAPRRHRHVPGEGGGQGPGPLVHPGHAAERADQGAVAERDPRRAGRGTSSSPTTSRSCTSGRARSSPPRRSCAGTIRATACCRRRRSSRPPRPPARSRRSTTPCWSRRAPPPPRWTVEDGYAPDASVHVNLSGEGLRTSELVRVVRDVLRRTGLAPRRLVLELTESVLIAEMPTAQPVLSSLRALGVRIALDDFGTGYSSLSCLRSLPVDILKVAKPFVDGAGRTPHDHALLAMIIELGSLFGVSVVAEGIERQDQLDALADLSCDMGQGFFLGRPLAGEARRFERRDALVTAA